MSADEFWMVYAEGRKAPAIKHHSFFSAHQESERLANKKPGVKFYVLQSVGFFTNGGQKDPIDQALIGTEDSGISTASVAALNLQCASSRGGNSGSILE